MKKVIIINIIILILLGITNYYILKRHNHKNELQRPIKPEWVKNMMNGVITNDTKLYCEGSNDAILYGNSFETFYFAFCMGLVNNTGRGFYDMYFILANFNGLYTETKQVENFKLYCLSKSFELGVDISKIEQQLITVNGNMQNSNFFLDQMKAK